MPLADWLLLAAVTLLASIAQAATGFGFGLILTPFLVIILNSTSAVQVTIAVTTVISLVVIPRIWRAIRPALLLRFVIGSTLGFPVGIYAYLHADLVAIKLGVGALILVFTAFVFVWNRKPLASARTEVRTAFLKDVAVGVVSGALTATLGMPGPTILIYLLYLRLHQDNLRGTTLSLFAFSYLASLAIHAVLVGIAPATWQIAGGIAPIAIIGALLGHFVAGRLSTRVFQNAVLLILGGAGLYTVYSALAM